MGDLGRWKGGAFCGGGEFGFPFSTLGGGGGRGGGRGRGGGGGGGKAWGLIWWENSLEEREGVVCCLSWRRYSLSASPSIFSTLLGSL